MHINCFRRRLIARHKVEYVKLVVVADLLNVSALGGAMAIAEVAVLAVDPYRQYANHAEEVVQQFPYWVKCTLKTKKIMECDEGKFPIVLI